MAETVTEEREEEPASSPASGSFSPKADYGAWGRPSPQWVKWVAAMRSSHHSTWQRAGILDAIINTTFFIHRRSDLISNLVEKWNPATNTFTFRWGEATVTLEDLTVLGGYSAAGESVFDSSPTEAEKAKLSELFGTRHELNTSKAKKASLSKWMSKYMGSASEVEHEAFLAYWLSKFVFPLLSKAIGKAVVPIAVRLGMGTRLALAQPLLASIYRALTLLKEGVAGPVKAPLLLVQVWAWERFPGLRPSPNGGATGPRMARWDGLWGGRCTSINFDGEGFEWRPYAVESFDVCVRSGELVGLERDCVERYQPHRVAMQLGMDRDRDLGPAGHVMDQDLPAGDAIGEEEEEEEQEQEQEQDLPAGDATIREEEEEEFAFGFGFKRTKRRYLEQFRRQRSVDQSCCASNSSEAFEDEGGDCECCCAPKSSEEFGNEEGNHEAVVRQATVDEKIDSSVRGREEERLRILEHLVRLLEEGKYSVCSPLKTKIRKLHTR